MKLLDLFCGAGGASSGYASAGFEVVGVDIQFQPNYPGDFVMDDAMTVRLDGCDVIHASPPTSALMVPAVMDRLIDSGKPWIIEHALAEPNGHDIVFICGSHFGAKEQRHRKFVTNMDLHGAPCDHDKLGQHDLTPKWMDEREAAQSLPPEYTAFLGEQMIGQIG